MCEKQAHRCNLCGGIGTRGADSKLRVPVEYVCRASIYVCIEVQILLNWFIIRLYCYSNIYLHRLDVGSAVRNERLDRSQSHVEEAEEIFVPSPKERHSQRVGTHNISHAHWTAYYTRKSAWMHKHPHSTSHLVSQDDDISLCAALLYRNLKVLYWNCATYRSREPVFGSQRPHNNTTHQISSAPPFYTLPTVCVSYTTQMRLKHNIIYARSHWACVQTDNSHFGLHSNNIPQSRFKIFHTSALQSPRSFGWACFVDGAEAASAAFVATVTRLAAQSCWRILIALVCRVCLHRFPCILNNLLTTHAEQAHRVPFAPTRRINILRIFE